MSDSPRSIAGRQRIAQSVIGEVLGERRIPVRCLVGKKRYPEFVAARRLIAHRLAAAGFPQSRIAEVIGRNRGTVRYYLKTGQGA